MTHHHHEEPKHGFWYTYFGIGGASAFAFIWVILALTWIFSVVNWG